MLVVASFLLALPPVLWRLRLGRALRTRANVRALGAGQLVLGAVWVLWGALYLRDHGRRDAAGWYAVVFGLLWCWQALRRLFPAGRR